MRRLWKPLARRLQHSARKARRRGLQTHDARLEALEQRQMLSISATDDAFAVTGYATGTPTTVSGNVRTNDVAGTGAFLLSNPSHGSLGATFQSSGAFTYTPNANYTGSDSFNYLLVDATEKRPTVDDQDTVPDVTDAFGDAVAVSGEWAIVGAKWDDEAGQNAGAAYVFHWENADWKQKQKLVPASISTDANFGYSVSIDGSHILVGAPYDNANSKAQSGSVYAYEFDGVSWANPQKLTLNSAVAVAGDWFGNSVDVDGNLAVIGAPQRDDNSLANSGSAYVFGFSTAGSWSYGTQLNPNSSDRGAGDLFGMSVAIDANRVVVGADGDDTNTGSAFVFDYATSWSQTAKLVASDRAAGDLFGWSVGVSGDRVIVGAREKTVGTYTKAGAAYLYEKSGSSWAPNIKLVSGESQNDVYFGWAVGIDGDTVVVGGYGYDQASLQNVGAAYVYRKLNGAWPQANKLVSSLGQANVNGAYSVAAIDGDLIVSGIPFATTVTVNFGSVAFFKLYQDIGTVNINVLSSSTTVAAVDDRFTLTEGGTTSGANVLSNDTGATAGAYLTRKPTTGAVTSFDQATGAFTYSLSGSSASGFFGTDAFTYTLKQLTERKKSGSAFSAIDPNSVQAEARFGFSVAMDGDVAVIGAPYEDNGAVANVGAVYIMRWNGSDWVAEQKIWGENADDLFGYDVAISGGRIVVGAFYAEDGSYAHGGAAYVLEHDGKQWPAASTATKLTRPGNPAGDYWFGLTVAISGDTVVVGAPLDASVGTNAGSAYVFHWNGNDWGGGVQLDGTTLGQSNYDQFGQSVAIDGNQIVVGAINDAGSVTGAIYIFKNTSGTWSPQVRKVGTGLSASDQFGWSVDISGDMIAVGARYHDVSTGGGSVDQAGAVYLFQGAGNSWTELTPLTLSSPGAQDFFGFDVALDGDTLVVGAYQDDSSGSDNAGAVHIYRYDPVTSTWTLRHSQFSGVNTGLGGYGVGAVWGDMVLMGIPYDSTSKASAGSVGFYEFQNGSVLLNVLPGANNGPQKHGTIGPFNVSEDSPDTVVQLANYFTDPDVAAGDTISYSVSVAGSTAAGAKVVGNTLVIHYADDQTGTTTFTITATDLSGLNDTSSFQVTVNAVEDLPRIQSVSDSPSVINRGQALTLTAKGVADPDDSITGVSFYRDSNGNGLIDKDPNTGAIVDAALGAGTLIDAPTGTWQLITSATSAFEDGQQTYFAVATSSDSLTSEPARAYGEVYSETGTPIVTPISLPKMWTDVKVDYQITARSTSASTLSYAATMQSGPAGQDGTWFTNKVNVSTGLISAEPAAGNQGVYIFEITVSAGSKSVKLVCACTVLLGGNVFPSFDGFDLAAAPDQTRIDQRIVLKETHNPLEASKTNAVDFAILFSDPDDVPSALKVTVKDVPLGLSWESLATATQRSVHIYGTVPGTNPAPSASNIHIRVTDDDGHYIDEEFYLGIQGWIYREDDPSTGCTLKGVVARDVYYLSDQNYDAGVVLDIQKNDLKITSGVGLKPGTLDLFDGVTDLGGSVTLGSDGRVTYVPPPEGRPAHDAFQYRLTRPLQFDALPPLDTKFDPGSLYQSNTVKVDLYYIGAEVRSDSTPPCTCPTPIGGGSLKSSDAGKVFLTMGIGGGGEGGACGCAASGGEGGRSPNDPRLLYVSTEGFDPTELLNLMAGHEVSNPSSAPNPADPPSEPAWRPTQGSTAVYKLSATLGGQSSIETLATGALPFGESLTLSKTFAFSSDKTGVYNRSIQLQRIDNQGTQSEKTTTWTNTGVGVILNYRNDSAFGNRWVLDVLDRLFLSTDPPGAMLVTGEGETFWFPYIGGVYQRDKTDPLFRTLTTGTDPNTGLTQYHLMFKDGSEQIYDNTGNLLYWDDRLDNRTTFSYTSGLISQITDYGGRTMTFGYSGGKVQTISDFAGRVTTLDVQSENGTYVLRSVRGIDPNGPNTGDLTQFAYDATTNLLTKVTAPDLETTEIVYDAGRKVVQIVGTGGVPLMSYERAGAVGTGKPALGGYVEGGSGQLAVVAAGSGGMRGSRTDALGQRWQFTLDSLGFLTSETDPLGNTTRWTRNGAGLIKSQIDPLGATTSYAYDTRFNLIRQTLPDGTVRSWEYEATFNRVTKFVDDVGGANQTTTFAINGTTGNVDSATQIVGTEDTGGLVDDLRTAYTYTTKATNRPAGLVTTITDPLGQVTAIDYYTNTAQNAGRVKTVTRAKYTPDVSAVQYEYNAAGNVTKYTDELGRKTNYVYDNAGRLTTIKLTNPDTGIENAGPTIAYTYAFADYVASVTDENGQTTRYQYNRHRQIERVLEADADGGGPGLPPDTFFLFDLNGNLLTTVEAGVLGVAGARLDRTTGNVYDSVGRTVKTLGAFERPFVAVSGTDVGSIFTSLVDDSDTLGTPTPFTASGTGWSTAAGGMKDVSHHYAERAATPTATATWLTAAAPPAEPLEVFVTWTADGKNATDATYTIYKSDGTSDTWLGEVKVNQQLPPAAGGSTSRWFSLGEYTPGNSQPRIKVVLTNAANGRIVADAIRVVDARPDTVYTYDAGSRVNGVTDPLGRLTNYQYDVRNQLTAVRDPIVGGPYSRFSYDNLGRLTETIDPLGRVTTQEYDAAGRLAKSRQPYPSVPWIEIDDQNPGTSTFSRPTGTWTEVPDPAAGGGDYQTAPNTASATAWWTFNVTSGKTYDILATWVPLSTAATNAHYQLWNGAVSGSPTELAVNQRLAPAGDLEHGAGWQKLGRFTPGTSQINVKLSNALYNQAVSADGLIIADTIRLVEAPVDDEDDAANPAFSTPVGTWKTATDGGHDGDFHYAASAPNSPATNHATAQWSLSGLTAGKTYEIVAGWLPTMQAEAASNAPFVVTNGATSTEVRVNQRVLPAHPLFGTGWQSLGSFTATGTSLTVSLNNFAAGTAVDGKVLADAVRILEVPAADGAYAYDKNGNLTGFTDAAGGLTQYAYDAQGRLVKVTEADPDGASNPLTSPVTQYTFDAAGELTKVRDPLARDTTYQYDYLGRLILSQAPDPDFDGPDLAPTTQYLYDKAGNLLASIDRLGQTTATVYDNLYRQVASVDPLGGRTSYVFDPAGNLASLTDPGSNTTTWVYDPRGRAIKESVDIDGATKSRSFVYNAADELTKKTDRLGRITWFTYDGPGRLKTETSGTHVITYAFDPASQLTSVTDVDGNTTFANYSYLYDQMGRTTRVTATNLAGLTNAYQLDQTFDSRSNRAQLKATVQSKFDLQNDYTYDALSRLTTLTQTKQGTGANYNAVADKKVDFGYDAAGQWQSIKRYSDLTGTSLVALTNFTYDRDGRLASLTHERNNSQIAGYQYAYDPVGRLTRIDSSIDEVSQFNYDRTGQLTGAQNTFEKDEAYTYDANGNRTGTNYSTSSNRLLSDPTYTYEYDAEGNRTSRTDRVSGDREDYTWDYRNRLVKVVFKGKDTSGVLQQSAQLDYTYDAFDRLVKRSLDKTTPFDGADAALEYYGYDGEDLLFDISDPDGAGTTQPAIKHRYLHGPAVDQVLAQENVGGETLWMLTDHQGSIRDLVRNDGTIAAHYQYDSFGKPLDGLESVTRFGYAGYERDTATGYYKTDARWYDPQTGKWLSEDPSGLGPDSNPFRYTGNSPTNWNDPTGRAWGDRIERQDLPGGGKAVYYVDGGFWSSVPQFIGYYDEANGRVFVGDDTVGYSEIESEVNGFNTTSDWVAFIRERGKKQPSYAYGNMRNDMFDPQFNCRLDSSVAEATTLANTELYHSATIGLSVTASAAILARGQYADDALYVVGRHGSMPSPRAGQHSHHGVMSAWMKARYSTYDANKAPAILMPTERHTATFGVFNKWKAEMTRAMGGKFEWSKVCEQDIRALSEKMFDAADVPTATRQEYWQAFDRMKNVLTQ